MDNSNRREFLYGLGASLGAVALTDLLAQDGRADDSAGPLAEKPPMHPARAKAVIMLFMHIYTPCIIASCHVLSVSQPDAPSGPPEVNTELHLRLPQIYKNSQTHHKK